MNNLISWCFQFVHSKSVILDINPLKDEFKDKISKICGKYQELIDLNNYVEHEEFLVDFIRIDNLQILQLEKLKIILENNNYPYVLLLNSDDSLKEFFSDMNYKIVKVSGCENCYLICDHEERILSSDAEIWSIIYNSGMYDYNNRNYKQALQKLNNAYNVCEKENKQLMISEKIIKCARKVNNYKLGMEFCCNIIYSFRADWSLRNETVDQLKYYTKPLPFHTFIGFGIQDILDDKYHVSSPSLLKLEDGFYYNIRAVNYNIDHDGSYLIRDQNDIIISENYMVKLDKELKKIGNFKKILYNSDFPYSHNIKGLEDIRLINKNSFFCTCLEFNEKKIPQICYGKFIEKEDCFEVISLVPIVLKEELTCEKNWLPYLEDNKLNFIYSFSPYLVYSYNERKSKIIKDFKSSKNLDFLRGSSPPIPYSLNGVLGKLMVCHIVYYNSPRKYFHVLFWIKDDEDFIYKISEPFYFNHIGIEYNLSIAEMENNLAFTFSVNDSSAQIALISLDKVNKLF